MEEKGGMTFIVKITVALIAGFMIIFGVSLIIYGHLTPGGGFPGGVVIAITSVALVLAFGREKALKIIPDFTASLLDSLAVFAFLLIGLLGLTGGYFFYNFITNGTAFNLWSSGTIIFSNTVIAIKVGTSLYAIFLALAFYGRLDKQEGK